MSVGTHRGARPLTPVQAAALFKQAADAGSTPAASAEATHVSASMVSRFLKLMELAPDIQHLVDWGQSGSTLSFSSAFELSRLPPQDHQAVATSVLEHGFSSAEVRQLAQLRRRSHQPIEESIAGTLAMRPRITRKHVFVGAVTDGAVATRLGKLDQTSRDSLLEAIAARDLGLSREVSSRLGVRRFTLVGDDDMSATLNALDDFEATINSHLERELTK
ncbi:MAG: hypothetical protein ACYCVN_09000 [Acidimicrobiales bacterium]